MCWSASADLVAGAAISAVGVACVTRAARVRRRALPLAALPLLLGAHQLVEAVVWNAGGGTGPATLVWAVIALPLLPLWVSFGVLCVVPRWERRRLLMPVAAAVVTSAVLAYVLVTKPVAAEIRGHTMGYAIGLPYAPVLLAGYLLGTIGALVVSGEKGLRMLGCLAGVGAALCATVWRLEFISTWCAWAALCSVVLFRWVGAEQPAPPSQHSGPVRGSQVA
ncbi:hypothetical protein G6045_03125 [Streptomyces sp. YC504]|uniref:Integral membrane protein n=1 Tax=Streptomyces mesophilus TaxID=1775132 RepID=A0A6G4XBR5_9ACTN|nr:DUF6629 family protein [Streptomyces mesophilus]NGO74683.1 hypothetical protein [Streptomyces mesophilus]